MPRNRVQHQKGLSDDMEKQTLHRRITPSAVQMQEQQDRAS
jgi:hypothetical protein